MDDEKKAQILDELGEYINEYPRMLESDLTAQDIAGRYGITDRQALTWMERTEREHPEEWERAKTQPRKGGRCRWVWVLRRKHM